MYIHSHTDHREGLAGKGWKRRDCPLVYAVTAVEHAYIYYMHRELCGDEQTAAKDREWPKG